LKIRPGVPKVAVPAWFEFFWARNAIFHGLRALGIQPGEKVLVPAYLCTAAIEPIEHFGAEVEFYAIQRDCVPDWADLEARIRGNVRAILAVHYFGFPCDIEKFRGLRERHNLFLIEDCAHVLDGVPSPQRLGEAGDFSVFSPRKFLPIFDGGRLRLGRPSPGFEVRCQFESPLFTLRVAKDLVDRRKAPTASLLPPAATGKLADDKKRSSAPPEPLHVLPNGTEFLPWMADFPMSRLSRHLARHFPLLDIAAKRRANYHGLLERVSRFEGVRPLFDRLPDGVVPWVLPLTIGERCDAHTALRARGIPAVTWGGVRDSRVSAAEFPDADFLYDGLVFLPIHQSLKEADLDRIAEAVGKVVSSPNRRS
jgi:hypothetical protein